MATDYISRDSVLDLTARKNSIWDKITDSSGRGLTEIVNSVPAANVVEVVRCRDCIHAPEPGEGSGSEIRWPKIANAWTDVACPFYCDDTYYSRRPDPEGFCSKGERRTQTDGQLPE